MLPGMWQSVINFLPRGTQLPEGVWQRRHRLLLVVLALHVPALVAFGVALGRPLLSTLAMQVVPVAGVVLGAVLRRHRRLASIAVTGGLVWCSGALVALSGGSIEAHFHFFIIIGFIALYQDWVPFLFNVLFTVISHGVGSMWLRTLMFNHPAAQENPWLWSMLHGLAVLFACVGVVIFWRLTEDEQTEKDRLTHQLADAEIGRRQFTSDMLLNLARRNQSMLYRQLEIINQLEESERDPDALAELFRLDHLATRVRRNAESLLVLSGEKPPRVWSEPVPLRDVVLAAIAETEDMDRVSFDVDERPLVDGSAVTDLTHLIAELTENAVRFSPPDTRVTLRARPNQRERSGQLLTIEDWGVGMPPDEVDAANALLTDPPEIDMSVSKRLGFHVVARLAARHGIRVTLTSLPESGIRASVALPAALFEGGSTGQPVPARPTMPRRVAEIEARVSAADTLGTARTPAPRVADLAAAAASRSVPAGAPAPATNGSPSPRPSWQGWWQGQVDPEQGDGPAVAPPSAAPASAAAQVGPVGLPTRAPRPSRDTGTPAPEPVPTLRRRVPLANLAPELRRAGAEPAPHPAPTPALPGAAAALSRYQASRQAAVDDLDTNAGDGSRS